MCVIVKTVSLSVTSSFSCVKFNIASNLTKSHCTPSSKFSRAFFHICHPFPSKCMLQMRKRRKSNLIWIFFYDRRKFRRQCINVIDNVRSYLFFTVRKFRTLCAMTLSWTGKLIFSLVCFHGLLINVPINHALANYSKSNFQGKRF